MRDVRQAHAEVVDDVVPLPAGLRSDRRGAVHQAVEHRVETGLRHARVAGDVTTLAAVLGQVAEVLRDHEAVVVERDREVLVEEALHALLLGRTDLDLARRDAVELLRERELAVVRAGLEILEAAEAGIPRGLTGLGCLHLVLPYVRPPILVSR
jgi:hypothetical protein